MKDGYSSIPFEKINLLDSYFIHRYNVYNHKIQVKFNSG